MQENQKLAIIHGIIMKILDECNWYRKIFIRKQGIWVVFICGLNKCEGNMSFWKKDGILNLGAFDCDIKFVEWRIGYYLPQEYQELIKDHNGGYVQENKFYYIDANNEVEFGSIYMLNLFDILKVYLDPPEFFPKSLVPFADDGGGDLTCFDYRNCKENPPIVFWVCGAPEGEDVHFVANSFDEFLGMLYKDDTLN